MTAIPHPLGAAHDDVHDHVHEHGHDIPFVGKYLFSTDHKVIGIQFLFIGLLFMVLGGLLAMLVRWQLAWPDNSERGLVGRAVPILSNWLWGGKSMPADFYYMAFSMHASVMIFFAIIPLVVGFLGNYLIPLQIGAPDMAIPFLNGFAFWSSVPAGALMLTSFMMHGGAAAAGWTSYPPLSSIIPPGAEGSTWPLAAYMLNFVAWFACFAYVGYYYIRLGNRYVDGVINIAISAVLAHLFVSFVSRAAFDGQSCWFLSLILLGFTSLMGVVNYLTTIIKMRCPGMTMFRMPLTTWALFITSILVLLSTPVLASALTLNLLDHNRLTSFFLPYNWTVSKQIPLVENWAPGGGFPLLHQHLFWFYSHPAVYIMILPTMGVASDIIACFARKPVFGYRPMVYALAGIAFLGFIVWAHHMFQSGMNPTLGTTFAVSTMFIAVPSAIKVFNWLGTLWRGNIRFTAAFLFAIGFVSMFVIGGLSGIFMASTAVDVHIHDTYFIVAHIHYVLFGGSIMGVLMSIYFWYPKMFGRMMNDKLGITHFILTFTLMNLIFFPMHMTGMNGMPRRVHDYTQYDIYAKFLPLNRFMTYCALMLGLSQILIIVNFIGSLFWGKKAPQNPWKANSLEWVAAPTTPPHGNFEKLPVVHHGPYEYSSPLVAEDWLPQTQYVEGAEKLAHLGH
ncbi:MAG TPA: cbb3-type cytochrome c oxidase subunit I [Tepidisphaeraceae bacterium]|nr:cbb3-type cytochrome c oxidase subunit I [Tepidisphaeraceae bacterium]